MSTIGDSEGRAPGCPPPEKRAPLPPAAAARDSNAPAAPGGHQPPLVIASEALLAGRTEVQISHRGELYRLTLTRAGKLILHK